jgi:hypothetical protein
MSINIRYVPLLIFRMPAISQWVVLKKFRCLLWKRRVGIGVEGIHLEDRKEIFDCTVCQCCNEKHMP